MPDISAAGDFIKLTLSALVGASAAIVGQYFANKFADRRHALELAQRERIFWGSFLLPVATSRAASFQEIYEVLQKTIEENRMSLQDYERMRRLLIYLPSSEANQLVQALSTFVKSTDLVDDERAAVVNAIRQRQVALRTLMGLDAIEAYITGLKSETDKKSDLRRTERD